MEIWSANKIYYRKLYNKSDGLKKAFLREKDLN